MEIKLAAVITTGNDKRKQERRYERYADYEWRQQNSAKSQQLALLMDELKELRQRGHIINLLA